MMLFDLSFAILDGHRPGDWKDQSDEDSKLLNVQAAEPTAYICSLPRIKVAPNQLQPKTKSACPDEWFEMFGLGSVCVYHQQAFTGSQYPRTPSSHNETPIHEPGTSYDFQ